MKKTLTLLGLIWAFSIYAQDIPKRLLDQVRKNGNTENHITAYYTGQIVLYGFKGYWGGNYLNNIAFRKENNEVIKLWIEPDYGQELVEKFGLYTTVQVKVTGHPLLLEEIQYRDGATQEMEKELRTKFKGVGYLQQISKDGQTLELPKKENSLLAKNLFSTNYETILEANVLRTEKGKGRERFLIFENDDTLVVDKSSWNNEYLSKEKVSYLRPKIEPVPGFYYPTTNTFQVASGFLLSTGQTAQRVPILGSRSVFVNHMTVKLGELIPDNSGLVTMLSSKNQEEEIAFTFSSKDAKPIQSFMNKHSGEVKMYFKPLTPDGHAKSEKDNVLYAIANETDTLITDAYFTYDFNKDHYLPNQVEVEGTITEIFYPEKVNKFSHIETPQTVETGFRAMLINDSVYLKIRDFLAISIANYVAEGKKVSFKGWKRKLLENEINAKGYTIMVPSEITIDGKLFRNNIDLTRTL